MEEATFHVGYYEVVFFVLIFAQEHVKDFISTLSCLLMSFLSEAIPLYFITKYNCSYYEAVMFFEALVFFFSVLIIGSSIGVMLAITSCISFFVNFIGYWIPLHEFYVYYRDTYIFWNILVFEILVWCCLLNSRFAPSIKKMDTFVKNKVDTYIKNLLRGRRNND